MSFECLDFGGTSDGGRDVDAMSSGSARVYEYFHEQIDIFPAKTPSVDVSFFSQSNGVSLACDCIFDFDVVLGEIFDYLRLFLILSVSMAQFAVSAATEGVQLS